MTYEKAYRHPKAGRIIPGRSFGIDGISYPPNWLEHATPEDLERVGITVSDDPTFTEADIEQELQYHARQKEKEETIQGQYEALGRFVQAFELMVDAARSCCVMLLSSSGKQQQLVNIALHNSSVSAYAVIQIFRALVYEILSDSDFSRDSEEKDAALQTISYIAKEYSRLMELRNDILHATWFIGWGNPAKENFSEMIGKKMKATAKGLQFASLPTSAEELQELAAKCSGVEELIRVYFICLVEPSTSFNRNFTKEGGVWKRKRTS